MDTLNQPILQQQQNKQNQNQAFKDFASKLFSFLQYQDAQTMFTQMAANPNASPAMKYLAMRIGQGF